LNSDVEFLMLDATLYYMFLVKDALVPFFDRNKRIVTLNLLTENPVWMEVKSQSGGKGGISHGNELKLKLTQVQSIIT